MRTSEDITTIQDRATIYLQILRRIPERGFTTTRQILDQLEEIDIRIPMRKLQRYLDAMIETDIYGIECDTRRKPYGYRKVERLCDLGTDTLSATDCLLLRLAEENMRYQMPTKITLGLKPLFDSARSCLNESKNGKEKKWLKKVAIVGNCVGFQAPNIRPVVFERVSKALYEEVQLEIKYFSGSKQEEKKHTVHPLGLVQQDVRIYLVCRFDGYDDIRSIALHRVKTATPLTEKAVRPKDFDLNEYVKHEQAFNYDRNRWVELSFTFTNPITKLNLEETPFVGRGQTIEELPDKKGWKLTAQVRDSRLLDGWLAMWKNDAGIKNVKKKVLDDSLGVGRGL